MMDTWGKLLKVQFPTRIPLAASHLQLTHPIQPAESKDKKNCKTIILSTTKNNMFLAHAILKTNLIPTIDKKIVQRPENNRNSCC